MKACQLQCEMNNMGVVSPNANLIEESELFYSVFGCVEMFTFEPFRCTSSQCDSLAQNCEHGIINHIEKRVAISSDLCGATGDEM